MAQRAEQGRLVRPDPKWPFPIFRGVEGEFPKLQIREKVDALRNSDLPILEFSNNLKEVLKLLQVPRSSIIYKMATHPEKYSRFRDLKADMLEALRQLLILRGLALVCSPDIFELDPLFEDQLSSLQMLLFLRGNILSSLTKWTSQIWYAVLQAILENLKHFHDELETDLKVLDRYNSGNKLRPAIKTEFERIISSRQRYTTVINETFGHDADASSDSSGASTDVKLIVHKESNLATIAFAIVEHHQLKVRVDDLTREYEKDSGFIAARRQASRAQASTAEDASYEPLLPIDQALYESSYSMGSDLVRSPSRRAYLDELGRPPSRTSHVEPHEHIIHHDSTASSHDRQSHGPHEAPRHMIGQDSVPSIQEFRDTHRRQSQVEHSENDDSITHEARSHSAAEQHKYDENQHESRDLDQSFTDYNEVFEEEEHEELYMNRREYSRQRSQSPPEVEVRHHETHHASEPHTSETSGHSTNEHLDHSEHDTSHQPPQDVMISAPHSRSAAPSNAVSSIPVSVIRRTRRDVNPGLHRIVVNTQFHINHNIPHLINPNHPEDRNHLRMLHSSHEARNTSIALSQPPSDLIRH